MVYLMVYLMEHLMVYLMEHLECILPIVMDSMI